MKELFNSLEKKEDLTQTVQKVTRKINIEDGPENV